VAPARRRLCSIEAQDGDQLPAGGRQGGERLAQRGMPFGLQQFLMRRPSLLIGVDLGV
jgi:hypothetical protein